MPEVTSIEQLESIYSTPGRTEASIVKVTPVVTDDYRALIEASPFVALATCGPEGLDCSPRGDVAPVVKVVDEKTLHMPDRRGNNRVDSLRNMVRDPRVALLFLLPGSNSTVRVNGTARVTTDPALLNSYEVEGQLPRTVIVITVNEVYFQCGRAVVRSDLWNADKHIDSDRLPTPGCILSTLTDNQFDGKTYDREWPERARKTLW